MEGAGSMQRSVYLLRPDGREPVPAERAFIDTLGSCCRAAGVVGLRGRADLGLTHSAQRNVPSPIRSWSGTARA